MGIGRSVTWGGVGTRYWHRFIGTAMGIMEIGNLGRGHAWQPWEYLRFIGIAMGIR